MKLAILFWIYKEIDVCVNRAQWLRRENPDTPIYCLYGGPIEDAAHFEQRLIGLVDDYYAFAEDWDLIRKWLNGDQMLSHWYRERGAALDWDTIFIAQWDMVLLTSARKICGGLKEGEIILPGLRPISEVAHFWNWTKPGSKDLEDFERFRTDLEARDAWPDEPLCCNFLTAALPRAFLARYAEEAPENGFLEYKIPILAQSWGFTFCLDHPIQPKWLNERKFPLHERFWVTLHAEKFPIRPVVLAANRAWPWGHRVFHPVFDEIPLPAK